MIICHTLLRPQVSQGTSLHQRPDPYNVAQTCAPEWRDKRDYPLLTRLWSWPGQAPRSCPFLREPLPSPSHLHPPQTSTLIHHGLSKATLDLRPLTGQHYPNPLGLWPILAELPVSCLPSTSESTAAPGPVALISLGLRWVCLWHLQVCTAVLETSSIAIQMR